MKPLRRLLIPLLAGMTLALLAAQPSWSRASVQAQSLDCPALFRAAVQAAVQNCADLGRNEACLASGSASLTPTAGFTKVAFSEPGDRIDAASIDSLAQTGGDAYALTVMRLQLNQPDTMPEHNSVLLLLGDVSLQQQPFEAASSSNADLPDLDAQIGEVTGEDGVPAPLQAFSFVVAPESPCVAALPQGVILQSPNLTAADEGYLPTEVTINDWRFALGSTVLVNAGSDGGIVADVLEHYASIGAQDGDILVLAGQGVELPEGTPYVASEDGSLTVMPHPTPEAGLFDGLLEELFGEEEIANRPPVPNTSGSDGNGRVEYVSQGDHQFVPEGIWQFSLNGEWSGGNFCNMNIWGGHIGEVDFLELDDMLSFNSLGDITRITWQGIDFSLDSLGDGRYEARNWALGDSVYEQINLTVVTPFYIQGRFVGLVRDTFAPRNCLHVATFSLESCLQDVVYDETDGSGICPAEIHEAMGTR